MRVELPTNIPGIDLRYFRPAPDLCGIVSYYYIFSASLPRVSDLMRADIGQLRFMLSGQGHYLLDGQRFDTSEVCLLGPSTIATRFDVMGPVLVFGVSLHPAGWATLVGEDASRHTNLATDAVEVFGPLLNDALDAMRGSTDPCRMVAIADVVVRALVRTTPPFALTHAVDDWLTGATDPSVEALVATLGISARQVERLVKRVYGAPPKLLSRKYRTLRAASLIGTSQVDWSDAVGDAFFDQSHFIRDFKRFTGLTPSQFRNDPPPVTLLTLRRRTIDSDIASLARVS